MRLTPSCRSDFFRMPLYKRLETYEFKPMQTYNQKTHKDESCEKPECDMCNQDEDICLEHLDPYVLTASVELGDAEIEQHKEKVKPYYKKINFQP